MLVTVIAEKTLFALQQSVQSVIGNTDLLELRIDYLMSIDVAAIEQIIRSIPVPMIFTLRKSSQGGLFAKPESQRLQLLEQLAQLKPAFIDLEHDVPIEFAQKLKQQHPSLQLIRSYHDFEKTPELLDILLQSLKHDSFSMYKIVSQAQSSLDVLRVLIFLKSHALNTRLSAFCMGDLGLPSRILGPILGNAFQYCSVSDDKATALGQLSLSSFLELYHGPSLNASTSIYALLGQPVHQSLGHLVHNRAFQRLGQNAVYVKFELNPEELAQGLQLFKALPFKGFSITMPLKQAVIPYLDKIDAEAKAMHSVNTIVIQDGQFKGYNTDAKAALDAIESKISVAGKTLRIIGTGATASAIGYEAQKRQAKLIFLSRSAEKARNLAQQLSGLGYGFEQAEAQDLAYDILVNASPLGMTALPGLSFQGLKAKTVVMDTVYQPKETPLLKNAKALDCEIIYGEDMFMNQALMQLALWFGSGHL